MSAPQSAIRISKLDAAKRQLQTAITMWFNGGDPVSTHTLAYAAYEIAHAISKKRDPNRPTLLFDTDEIKPEYRKQYAHWLKTHANFFKHADRDSEGAFVDLRPEMTEMFILFAVIGLELCGESRTPEEAAFSLWYHVHKTHILREDRRKLFEKSVPVDTIAKVRQVPKGQFLETFFQAQAIFKR
jgi:hypothetical protein